MYTQRKKLPKKGLISSLSRLEAPDKLRKSLLPLRVFYSLRFECIVKICSLGCCYIAYNNIAPGNVFVYQSRARFNILSMRLIVARGIRSQVASRRVVPLTTRASVVVIDRKPADLHTARRRSDVLRIFPCRLHRNKQKVLRNSTCFHALLARSFP